MTRHAASLFVVSAGAWHACGGASRVPPAPPDVSQVSADASTETVVRTEDDGRTFDVASGSTVTFELAANAGTGYAWAPAGVDPAVLVQKGDRTSVISTQTPGAPKVDVYHFLAMSPGSTTVEMSLRRPFGSAPPDRVVRVTIHVP
jgi:predicted secreted protein